MACAVLGGLSGALAPRLAYRWCGTGRRGRAAPGWLWVPLGAATFAGLGWALGPVPLLGAALIVAAAGLALAATDVACLRLPDPLVGAGFAGAAAVLCTASVAAGDGRPLLRSGLAALGCTAAYAVLAAVPRTGLGLGDAKLAGLLGLLLGWLGWPAVLLGLALPYACNGPVVLGLLLTGRIRRDTALPFGPALLAGAYLAVLAIR